MLIRMGRNENTVLMFAIQKIEARILEKAEGGPAVEIPSLKNILGLNDHLHARRVHVYVP